MSAIRIKRRLDSDTLHLPELRPLIGREVEIVVTEQDGKPSVVGETGDLSSILALADRAGASIPPDVLRKLPRDGAAQHDHYLYGTPKREP